MFQVQLAIIRTLASSVELVVLFRVNKYILNIYYIC